MKILIAICTFNRAVLLRETLESLVAMTAPVDAEWSILVVNNNCTDDTDRVVAEFSERLPIRSIHERRQGLSNARNAAIASSFAADADYIIWTDDDVRVNPGWLCAYVSGFRRYPEASVFGGNIVAWFEKAPPVWLEQGWEALKGAFAVREFAGEFPLKPDSHDIPFGANFAVRMIEQRQRTYDPKLGVNKHTWLGGEETGLILELLGRGCSGWWLAGIDVKHFIPESRMRLRYLAKYFRGLGRTDTIRGGEDGIPAYKRPRWMWKKMVQTWLACVFYALRRDSKAWAQEFRQANYYLGRLID